MKKPLLAFAAVAALATGAAFATSTAFAGEVDPAGQYALQVHSDLTRAEVQAELAQSKQGANPWARDYDQLAGFHSEKTRAQVQAEFIGDREEATAMTGEDSGSAYLSKFATVRTARQYLAGKPVNAQ